MRMISQDGTIDVPYEISSLSMAVGKYEDVEHAAIYCHNSSTSMGTKMAEYSSKEKAKKAMEELRCAYMCHNLAKKMCDMLEAENGGAKCWRGTVLEPACGTGNFLVEILKRKLSIGMTETEAAETLFGIDILPDNVEESIQRLTELAPTAENIFRKNIVCGNFLKPEGIWFLEDNV